MRKPARRKCAHCREWFHPAREGQVVCSLNALARSAKNRQQKPGKRRRPERLSASANPRKRGASAVKQDWLSSDLTVTTKPEAQKAFNAYIRARDAALPCISCGETNPPDLHGGQWDCGHFKTVGAYPELRFEERNAHKQCKSCNAGAGKYTAKELTVAQQYEAGLGRSLRTGVCRLA